MKRFMVLLALIAISVPVSMNLTTAGDEPPPLTLEKECVLFGRIQGSHQLLYEGEKPAEPVYDPGTGMPMMTQIKGFEVLNKTTGEWHPLTLSEEGYFCANIGMGKYDLRGRDCEGMPYVIHSFNVPRGMAVNLGAFMVETCDPKVAVYPDAWSRPVMAADWHEYREGTGAIALYLEHITSEEAYEACEDWFAQCHGEAYDHFAGVIARR